MPASNLHAQVPTASGLTALAHCSLCVSFVGLGLTILFESWSNFVNKPLELSGLIPRGHAQSDVIQAGVEKGFKLLDALLWVARSGKTLDELHTEVGRVILVEERL